MSDPSTNKYHPIRAVAIDLDGTLLSHDLSISPENLAAIEDLHANGVMIIPASGRHHKCMEQFAAQLPKVDWMVSAQGSFTSNMDFSEILYDSHLAKEKAAQVIDIGLRHDYQMIIYAKSGLRTFSSGEWIDYYAELAGIPPVITKREEILDEIIFKISLVDTEERINAALTLPEVEAWDLYKVRSLKNLLEFAGNGTSKAHGLKPLMDHLGLKPHEIATFGDAPNDVPMFEITDTSVAMSTAWPEAKAAASKVAPEGPQETSFARAVAMLNNS